MGCPTRLARRTSRHTPVYAVEAEVAGPLLRPSSCATHLARPRGHARLTPRSSPKCLLAHCPLSKTPPLVDFRRFKHPAQSESEKTMDYSVISSEWGSQYTPTIRTTPLHAAHVRRCRGTGFLRHLQAASSVAVARHPLSAGGVVTAVVVSSLLALGCATPARGVAIRPAMGCPTPNVDKSPSTPIASRFFFYNRPL